MKGGREGDWECGGCKNRNYAFRSFCNRCKQPRLLVDTKTPPDAKWLPRIGDWICTGCTNNNYASREKCKKCGQPKEATAMPAIAVAGASLHQSLSLSSNWPFPGADTFGFHSASSWPLGGSQSAVLPYPNPANHAIDVPKGWRNGDWICNCGFHNYSSRSQCKNCNAPVPPVLGTKRLASEDLAHEWESKRLNSGCTNGQLQSGLLASYSSVSSNIAPNWPIASPFLCQPAAATLIGKGAKQWRSGDWMCTNCNNHNYASRSECNRCKTRREMVSQSIIPA